MRFAKSYLLLITLFLLIFAVPNSAFAFPKYKVALLPIINTAQLKTTEVSDLIQYKIHRKLRFPFYEFTPDADILGILKTCNTKSNDMIPDQKNLSFFSQTLSADIVLAVEVVKARSELRSSFFFWNNDNETIEDTDVSLKIYAYSSQDKQYYVLKAEKSNSTFLNANSGLIPATDPVIDALLKQLPFATIPNTI